MVNRNNMRRHCCYKKCMDWTHNSHKNIDEQLKYDIEQLKNGEKITEKNINIVILVFIFLIVCFLCVALLGLKSK